MEIACASHPFRAGVGKCRPVHKHYCPRRSEASIPLGTSGACIAHICHSVVPAVEDSKSRFISDTPPQSSAYKAPLPPCPPVLSTYRPKYTDATMLTLIQLSFLLFWTSAGFAGAEKLYHRRDHSDMQHLDSLQAQVISDEHAAEVWIIFCTCWCVSTRVDVWFPHALYAGFSF